MDRELEQFKTDIDLRAYAATKGYQLDSKESWSGSAVMRHPNNDKIVINRNAADGHHVYFSFRDDADNGTIIDFVNRRLGLSLGGVRKELRAFLAQPHSAISPYPVLRGVAKDRIRVERAYARMLSPLSLPYLEEERGIPRHILGSRRFAGRIRVNAHGSAVFPHFDAEGLSGFEIKGRGFTSFATGGTKGLWSSHIENGDGRIVLCESSIDALSYATLFQDMRTRYASLSGKPSPKQKELIRAAAAALPLSSTVIAAMDADAAGRDLTEVVREAVRLTGRTDLQFEAQEPQGFKDWNDVLRGAKAQPPTPSPSVEPYAGNLPPGCR